MRRGSGKQPQLASDKCSCETESEPMPHGDTGIYGVDPDCSVCRERSERAMTDYDREQQRRAAEDDKCRDDPPPPSPPTSGGAGARKNCPCEESPRRVNAALKHNSSSSSYAWGQQLQPPNQYQKHFQQHDASAAEQASPASELMGQVQDAVYRVLCSVFGAAAGGAAANTAGGTAGESQSQAQFGQDEQGEDEDEEEEEEEWNEGQEYEARTAPRFCVPTANNNASTRQPEEGASDNYDAFSDGFAS